MTAINSFIAKFGWNYLEIWSERLTVLENYFKG